MKAISYFFDATQQLILLSGYAATLTRMHLR